MEYKILISSDTPENLLKAIKQYWNYSEGKFVNKSSSINQKNEVLVYSKCLLILKRCRICGIPDDRTVNNRSEFSRVLKKFIPVCEGCSIYSPKPLKNIFLEDSIKDKLTSLQEIDLKILKGIVSLNSKVKIYRHIFANNIDDPEIWDSINYLQNLHLIWIDRDYNSRIISFRYDPELKEILRDF